MKRSHPSPRRLRTGLTLAVAAVAVCVLSTACRTTEHSKPAKSEPPSGATLYAMNCGRCHPERYPTEWTSTQWKTLMAHMRVRANLPAEEANAILKYLQEDSGTP